MNSLFTTKNLTNVVVQSMFIVSLPFAGYHLGALVYDITEGRTVEAYAAKVAFHAARNEYMAPLSEKRLYFRQQTTAHASPIKINGYEPVVIKQHELSDYTPNDALISRAINLSKQEKTYHEQHQKGIGLGFLRHISPNRIKGLGIKRQNFVSLSQKVIGLLSQTTSSYTQAKIIKMFLAENYRYDEHLAHNKGENNPIQVQTPLETLEKRSGTCQEFALTALDLAAEGGVQRDKLAIIYLFPDDRTPGHGVTGIKTDNGDFYLIERTNYGRHLSYPSQFILPELLSDYLARKKAWKICCVADYDGVVTAYKKTSTPGDEVKNKLESDYREIVANNQVSKLSSPTNRRFSFATTDEDVLVQQAFNAMQKETITQREQDCRMMSLLRYPSVLTQNGLKPICLNPTF